MIWLKIKHNRKRIKYTNETGNNIITYIFSCIKEKIELENLINVMQKCYLWYIKHKIKLSYNLNIKGKGIIQIIPFSAYSKKYKLLIKQA